MKPGSFLINIARGSVVDEDAMITALSSGQLAGAGLDVFDTEPLPTTSPLASMDQVVLGPHSLCWTDTYAADTSTEARDCITAAAAGRMPSNIVNPDSVTRFTERFGAADET